MTNPTKTEVNAGAPDKKPFPMMHLLHFANLSIIQVLM